MKFAKILQSELVPEWRKKYIDYRGLKRLIKSIEKAKIKKIEQPLSQREQETTSNYGSSRTNGLPTDPTEVSITIPQPTAAQQQRHSPAISVGSSYSSNFSSKSNTVVSRFSRNFQNAINKRKSFSIPRKECLIVSYDTLLSQISPQEKIFFKALEDNLNKIEKFYEMKMSEFVKQFDELNAQYNFMKESRIKKKLKENESWSNVIKQEIEHLSSLVTTTPIHQDEQAGKAEYCLRQDIDYKTAKSLIKKAVLEFYRGIELLKNYQILNQTGFVKILKKYDKISKRNGSEIYLPRIFNCNFVKSSELDRLIKETETFYINNFEEGARRKAMKKLRIPDNELKSYYFVTWRVGLYIGLSISTLARAIKLALDNRTSFDKIKWTIVLQIYSAYFIPITFALLFGINMYVWSKARINYKFIFEFDPRHNLDFRQFLEIPALMLLIFSYTIYIGFTIPSFVTFETYVWILGILLLSILLCPFRILYYNSRRWFIIAMLRVFASGFFRVEFRDFFIADELNSLTYTSTNTRLLFCAIKECSNGLSFLIPLLASLPPWWRFVQCLRRFFVTYQKYPHLLNAGKYFSSITAVWLLFLFRSINNNITKSFWIGGQTISSIYTFLWDVLMDWSLLQLNSKNYLLRDELSYKNHYIYYIAIVSDGLLRFSWVLQLIVPGNYTQVTLFVIAFGEMLRRWQWNFFRVENEHLNNCGHFRAIKEIPLPFEKEHDGSPIIVPALSSRSSKTQQMYETDDDDEQSSEIDDSFESLDDQNETNFTKNNKTLNNRDSHRELSLLSLEDGSRGRNNNNNNNGNHDIYGGTSAIPESEAEMSKSRRD